MGHGKRDVCVDGNSGGSGAVVAAEPRAECCYPAERGCALPCVEASCRVGGCVPRASLCASGIRAKLPVANATVMACLPHECRTGSMVGCRRRVDGKGQKVCCADHYKLHGELPTCCWPAEDGCVIPPA